jgi:hypothetical protein
MIWLTWRQHRLEVLIAGGVVLAVASALVFAGARSNDLVDPLRACQFIVVPSPGAEQCARAVQDFREALGWAPLLPIALILLPALAGSYLPAPMLAREYEHGTTKLAWAQGVTRTRWLVTKSALYAVVFALAALLLGALARFAQPAWTTGMEPPPFVRGPSPFVFFEWQWPLLLGSALFAVGLGLASAALTRRILASMFITVILFGATRLLIASELRPDYLPPIVVSSYEVVPQDAWRLESAALDSTGRIVPTERMRELSSEYSGDPSLRRGPYEAYLTAKGITFRHYYQPADRFWLFQVMEGTLFASLGVGLFVLALWLVRRRPA